MFRFKGKDVFKRMTVAFLCIMLICTMIPAGVSLAASEQDDIVIQNSNTRRYDDIFVEKIPGLSEDFFMGADISSLIAVENAGVIFRDRDGNPADMIGVLADAGVNYARIRVWNDPFFRYGDSINHDRPPANIWANTTRPGAGYSAFPGTGGVPSLGEWADGKGYGGGNNCIETAILIGKRTTQAGMRNLINFHYSDHWADPGKQRAPKEWRGMTQEQRLEAIYTFTYESLSRLIRAGVDVGMVQIGNETNSSMAGQTGNNMYDMMVHALVAVRNIMNAYPENGYIQTAIHLADPHRTTLHTNFANQLQGRIHAYNIANNLTGDDRIDYDIWMLSYYEIWHGSLQNLTSLMNTMTSDTRWNPDPNNPNDPYGRARIRKQAIVVEASYPYRLETGDGAETVVPSTGIPTTENISIQGQANTIRNIIEAVHNVRDGRGTGFFYWEPGWLPVNQAYIPEEGFGIATKDQQRNEFWIPGVATNRSDWVWNPSEVWLRNFPLWQEHGAGWASSFAAYYGTDEGIHYGGTGKDNQALFDFWGYPLPSLDIFNLVFTGQDAELRVERPLNDTITIAPANPLTLPTNIEVEFNNSTTGYLEITWNSDDVLYATEAGIGEFVLRGNVVVGEDAFVQTLTLNLVVIPMNLVTNPSFENQPWGTGWMILPGTGTLNVGQGGDQASNARTGTRCVHWGGTTNRGISQVIRNVQPGYYTLSLWLQGGAANSNVTLSVTGDSVHGNATSVAMNNTNSWGNFREVTLDNVLVAAPGDVTITIRVGGSGWGAFDDVYFGLMNPADIIKQEQPPLIFEGRNFDYISGLDVTSYIRSAESFIDGSELSPTTGELRYEVVSGDSIIHSNAMNTWLIDRPGETIIRAIKPAGNLFAREAVVEARFIVTEEGGIERPPMPAIWVEPVEQLMDGKRPDFIMGADVSMEPSLRESGLITWRDRHGIVDNLYNIMADSGINWVRARIWNDPYFRDEPVRGGGVPRLAPLADPSHDPFRDAQGRLGYGGGNADVCRAIDMGVLATAAGQRMLVNFHYSDFWADPARQYSPKAWEGMNMTERSAALYEFTYESLVRMVEAGVDIGMVQVGNETNIGMAGVSGDNALRLKIEGIRAVHAVNERFGLDIRTAVHYTDPQDVISTRARLAALERMGVDYDVFLFSWYPNYHGPLSGLTYIMNYIVENYDKDVALAEVSYSMNGGTHWLGYPTTVQGQAHIVRDAIQAVADVIDGRGLGVFYWEPAWPATNAFASQRYGTGWASRFASHYDAFHVTSGTANPGSSRVSHQMFNNVADDRRPLASLDVWNLVRTGSIGPALTVCSITAPMVHVVIPNTFTMPETVEVIYINNARIAEPVVWNEEQVQKAKDGPSGNYYVDGVITLESFDGSTREVRAQVVKTVENLVQNYSFEERPAMVNWNVTRLSGTAQMNFAQGNDHSGNARTGDSSVHWGDGTLHATISQTIEIQYPGYHTAHVWLQGAVNQGNRITLAVNGEHVDGNFSVTGNGGTTWAQFTRLSMDRILITQPGTVTLSITINAQGWGSLDDVYFAAMDTVIWVPPVLVDRMELQDLIAHVITRSQSNYTEETWAVLYEQLLEAQQVLADENATQEMVDTMILKLRSAVEQLVVVSVPVDTLVVERVGQGSGFNRLVGHRITSMGQIAVIDGIDGITIQPRVSQTRVLYAQDRSDSIMLHIYINYHGNDWVKYQVTIAGEGYWVMPQGAHRGIVVSIL